MLRTGFKQTALSGPLGFSRAEEWEGILLPAGFAFLGDDERGPVIRMMALPPGLSTDGEDGKSAPPHGHASDNFRIALRGSLKMGVHSYGPGEFRLQQGWKAYGSDTVAEGPDGGWEMLMFADRRGMRMRPTRTRPDDPIPYLDVEKDVAAWMGYHSDWFGDEPGATCLLSQLVSTLGSPVRGGITGSFADPSNWLPATEGSRVAVTLMGDAERGPVVVMACTEPSACAAGRGRIQTETFRLVVDGQCEIGEMTYRIGDMRIDQAGAATERVVAGEGGLKEIIVYGDRREIPSLEIAEGWPCELPGIVDGLLGEISQTSN